MADAAGPAPPAYIVPPCTARAVSALLGGGAHDKLAAIVAGPCPARAFYCFAMLCYYCPGLRRMVSGARWERFFGSFHLIVEDHLAFTATARETLHHFCTLLLC